MHRVFLATKRSGWPGAEKDLETVGFYVFAIPDLHQARTLVLIFDCGIRVKTGELANLHLLIASEWGWNMETNHSCKDLADVAHRPITKP